MKRKIVQIHKELCNGCGLCVSACHEGAIQMIDGKAELISDKYCDGLGDCLPACPTGAIEIIEREAEEYSQEAVDELKIQKENKSEPMPCGCPGTMAKKIVRQEKAEEQAQTERPVTAEGSRPSQLRQWPVQLNLINPAADYLEGANILIAADCTAYAYGDFHKDFIKDHVVIIGCPKLDDNEYYAEKLTEIFKRNNINSITVVRMEVPCCSGIIRSVKTAMLQSQTIVPYREVVVSIEGDIRG
ncbi:MAG: 4Fe-4S dicluster domain-containing protein [Firmicutes bacterium]|nr:4Fe-4S dicluster domain-containing protein [Bacillota bacterium]